ncbi:MAG: 23S rRNA (adenine(2503)-C(2))-methyltransferase RlmN [Deltaproteobacteria bacterium]|nr:23S rRNA (adenine(2503)-C(2))-methyltransferase RlmN [Deltaproteobacteria bacterium]MBW1929047.1 23S rRNA (adenine(2503)-C(2))-methyltransferase RlmN [Deltaproteobacteria bacterium]MBW2024580.1 23S rRNA (adenine(2503)-C(2))-methyltransferase RlmN [Deltaproteobacteria bacterium]MBW2125379.1 23S rRNA (adenine(2503)-C(2))-methyltransferase RlmN [Deltaproteobacteria bacterium]
MKTDSLTSNSSIGLKGLDLAETEAWAQSQGLPAYRGRQIRRWIFTKGAHSFEQMTDLPKTLRQTLAKSVTLNHLETVDILKSRDGTKKFIFRLHDGLLIESVLIPERDHLTLCISSQVGCAIGCRFCLTGARGLKRNLSTAEIVDQVVQVRSTLPEPEHLKNIVLMGMGEPLANYHNVIKALGNLTREDGMNFSNRRVTLSTSGLVPEMEKLGQDITVNLAVSLNATDDKTRSFLMPINDRYPIAALIQACKAFPLPNRRMITFEYILIKGINDSLEDAQRLVKLLKGLRAKVNLIPFNPHPGVDFRPSPMERILQFQEVLTGDYLTAIIRKSKGPDIMAACGQLGGSSNRGIQ